MDYRTYLSDFIDENKGDFIGMSDEIWGYAEPNFMEHKSSALQQSYLRDRGFSLTVGPAGLETAFIAEYGAGKPIIAFLGEFDSLAGLSQEAGVAEQRPIEPGGYGHGCGHHLLGTAALAAALGLKERMAAEGLPGTVRYYGCPAEEGGAGKVYLVRDGYFDDCDVALTWHPDSCNKARGSGSLANYRVYFDFYGISAHAATSPHLGRSALDAVELMNVGVNYMREHMPSAARVHYAVTNTGGSAPNVVQREAQSHYSIRAPKVSQAKELYERVCDIARGAALMTQTKVGIRLVAVYSDYIGNDTIAQSLNDNLAHFLPLDYTEEEKEFAMRFKGAITDLSKANLRKTIASLAGKENVEKYLDEPIFNFLAIYNPVVAGGGSSDVGDVSWVVPTAWLKTATWVSGTTGHSWQITAQGKSPVAHKGMLLAAKVLACTGYEYLTDPGLLEKTKETWREMLDGETYPNPLPPDVKPTMC